MRDPAVPAPHRRVPAPEDAPGCCGSPAEAGWRQMRSSGAHGCHDADLRGPVPSARPECEDLGVRRLCSRVVDRPEAPLSAGGQRHVRQHGAGGLPSLSRRDQADLAARSLLGRCRGRQAARAGDGIYRRRRRNDERLARWYGVLVSAGQIYPKLPNGHGAAALRQPAVLAHGGLVQPKGRPCAAPLEARGGGDRELELAFKLHLWLGGHGTCAGGRCAIILLWKLHLCESHANIHTAAQIVLAQLLYAVGSDGHHLLAWLPHRP